LQKEHAGSHVIVLNSPVEIWSSQNWLCDFFRLECNKIPPLYAFKANTNYMSKNIHNIIYPLSITLGNTILAHERFIVFLT